MPSGATIIFAGWLAIRTERFLGLAAPMNAAGELVIVLSRTLVMHFLVAQVATTGLESWRVFGGAHTGEMINDQ